MMRSILVGILVLMAAGIGFMTFDWYRGSTAASLMARRSRWSTRRAQPITEAAFRGHPSAVFFGFTHCPEVCPTTLFEMDGWLKKLGDDGKDVRAYFVSVDPERDTPEVMNAYVSNVSDRITGITGEPDKVARHGEGLRHLLRARSIWTTATTRWTTPPRSCCSTARAVSPAPSPMAKTPKPRSPSCSRLAAEG